MPATFQPATTDCFSPRLFHGWHVDRNPYSPPISPIADVVADAPTLESNREVMIACKLVWTSFALSAVGLIYEFASRSGLATQLGLLVAGAISFGFTWWYVSKLKAGRNWMRILVTIMLVLSYVSIAVLWQSYYAKIFANYPENPIKLAVFVLKTISSILTLVLINLPSSRAWFAAKDIPR